MPAEDAQHFHMVTNLTNMDKMNDMADRFETRLKTKKNKAKAAATPTVDAFTEEPSNE